MARLIGFAAATAMACSTLSVVPQPAQARQPDLPGDPDLVALCKYFVEEEGFYPTIGDCLNGYFSAATPCKVFRDNGTLAGNGYRNFGSCVSSGGPKQDRRR